MLLKLIENPNSNAMTNYHVSAPEPTEGDKAPSTSDAESISAAEVTSSKKSSAILNFFNTAGLSIAESSVPKECGIFYLVNQIADSLPIADEMLHRMRVANASPNKGFLYDLKGKSEEEKLKIASLADLMRLCGIFSEYSLADNVIRGKISESVRVGEFISGRWLELFCQMVTIKVVSSYAEKHGFPWEVLSNVIVYSPNGEHHELDLIFSIGDKVFGTEQKSGNKFNDYDKYRKIGLWLGLIPEHFLLVNSCLEDKNAAACIHYFYEYYVCNTADYEQTLMTMIENAMNE